MTHKTEYRNLCRLAYPIMLNYLLLTVFELLDKAIVGHYSVQGFAVVGIAGNVIYEVTGALGILSSAFHILAAEQKGQNREADFEMTFSTVKLMGLGIGMLFLLVSLLLGRSFFAYCYGMSGAGLTELLSYFYPAAVTVVQNILIFQYSAYYRNRLNTRISLVSTASSTVVNLVFDYALVYGKFGLPELGTAGAAWGSVIGLTAGLLVYAVPHWRRRRGGKRGAGSFDRHIAVQIWKLYPSLFGQELLESTVLVLVVTGVVARLGESQAAVYSLLGSVVSTIGLPVYACATAAQTLALQRHAAGEERCARRYLKCGALLAGAAVLLLGTIGFGFRENVLAWIVSDEETVLAAGGVMLLALAVPLLKAPYQVYMQYLQGIGREKAVFLCTAAAAVVVSGAVWAAGSRFGLAGIYVVTCAEYGVLAAGYCVSTRLSGNDRSR